MSAASDSSLLVPDLDMAAAFIAALTGSADTPVTFQTFHDAEKGKLAAIRSGTLATHASWLTSQNRKGAGIFVTVNETDGRGREKTNIVGLRALFVDDDKGAIPDPALLRVAPSIVVSSKAGPHCYWLLEKGQPLPECEPALKALIHHLGTDRQCKDINRVLRLPGFYHMKDSANPFMVTIHHADDSRRYTIADIMAAYPPVKVTPDAKSTLPPRTPVPAGRHDADSDEAYARRELARTCEKVSRRPEGDRNDFLNTQAYYIGGYVGAGAIDRNTAESALYAAAVSSGLTESESQTTVRSGLSAGARNPIDISAKRQEWATHRAARQAGPGVPERSGSPSATRDDLPPSDSGQMPSPAAPSFVEDYTERGQSRRFARLHGKHVKYNSALGFLVYDGQRWVRDEGEAMAMELVKVMVEEIAAKAKVEHAKAKELEAKLAEIMDAGTGDDAAGKAVLAEKKAAEARAAGLDKAFKELSKRSAIRSITLLAVSDPRITTRAANFDRDVWLFNTQNGTIDLRTGKLREHRAGDYITKVCPIPYEPEAACPTWEAFLMSIMANREALVRFLQVAIGYSLTGSTREQCFFILHGKGSNGKSVLSKTLKALLGEYGCETPAETLMIKRNENAISNDLARLAGMRMVGANETEDGQRLAEAKVKALTGDEPITARFLNKEFFDFQPEFKLWLRTNHKPVIKGTDEGIWRRIHLIPFEVQFAPEQQDKGLFDKLMAELPGILAWAVRGCAMYLADGLVAPPEIANASAQYRKESDQLAPFLDGLEVREYAGAEIYGMYVDWCKKTNEREMTASLFGRSLTDRHWGKRKTDGIHMRIHPGLRSGTVGQTLPELSLFKNGSVSSVGIVREGRDSFSKELHDEEVSGAMRGHVPSHEADCKPSLPTLPLGTMDDPDPLGEWIVGQGGFTGASRETLPDQKSGGAQ